MKIKNKIALTLLPLVLLSVLMINLIFTLFYKRTIDNQETRQVNSAQINISTYINKQLNSNLATAYDWAHWDDSYYFIDTKSSKYINLNLAENTFSTQNLSLAVYLNNQNSSIYSQYYSTADQEFANFPDGILDTLTIITGYFEPTKDINGIYRLGGQYYFLASTYITDSAEVQPPHGRIIFGWLIDESILAQIEEISNCSIVSIDMIDERSDDTIFNDFAFFKNSYINNSRDSRIIELVSPNVLDLKNSVMINLSMPRDQYISAMNDMTAFTVFNTLGGLLGALIIIWILSRYLSKPIAQLIHDIKTIDMTKNEFSLIPDKGRNEFSFLRKSINMLLSRISADQKTLFDSREELYATLISVGDGVIVVNKEEKVKFMNPVAQELTGWNIEDAKGKNLDIVFNIINEYTRVPVDSPVSEVFRTDSIIALSNHTVLISKDGTERAIEDTAAPIKDPSGYTNGCVLVFKDTSEKKEVHRRIEYLSFHDQLTGLYNRRFFESELKRLDVESGLPYSIIYSDVNGLKIINDAFGHESGDKIIQKVAEIYNSVCRTSDIVARVGGDEFVTLLPKTNETEVEIIVELLREQTDQLSYMDIDLSISFGWDTKCEEGQSAQEILRNAEDIMYQKKLLSSTSKRNAIIKSILNTLSVKCPREEEHSIRVSSICESIGYAYNLHMDDIKELTVAGELHDIGKIAIDETVLNKPDALTKSEWSQMKHHPEIGFRLLGATSEFNNIAEYVLAHHERWDGTGYPKGLKDNEISWKARVIAIADSYDAMTSDRPYRKGMNPVVAAAEIKKCAGTQFDPDIARVFIENVLKFEW